MKEDDLAHGEIEVRQSHEKWKPASAEWIKALGEAAARLPGAEQRKMFGYPAAFINGNMFAGLHESGLVLRLPDAERASLLKLRGSMQFEPMPGRPMREYVVAPKGFVSKPQEVKVWMRRALDHAASLPAKKSAPGKKKT